MFIDQVVIKLASGNGGDGMIAFRREKYVPLGGPGGGTGGNGSDIIFQVDSGLRTLLDFSYNKRYKGIDGENGKRNSMHGKNSDALILRVPMGTMIYDDQTGELLADLIYNGQEKLICKGGRGGRGNAELAVSGKAGLEISEKGAPGKEIVARLELKLISDVGLVGMPSVGKSTIISAVSKAKPKIAAYHFTTLTPKLGVVKTSDDRSYVIADLPGLIEGASLGKGLGYKFLRHIERTKIILHVLDMAGLEGRDPIDDFETINKELFAYKYSLENRKQIVVANKMDVPSAKDNLEKFKEKFPELEVVEISALTKSGLDRLLIQTADLLETAEDEIFEELKKIKVYKFEKEEDFKIEVLEEGQFLMTGSKIETLLYMTNFSTYDNTRRFANQLRKMGVDQALRDKGALDGDIIIIKDFEFEFED